MISKHNVKMVVGGIVRRGCGNAALFFVLFYEFVSFIRLGNIPSWTRGYRFYCHFDSLVLFYV